MHKDTDTWTDGDRVPTPAETREWQRENTFLPSDEATPDTYPAVYNMSAGMMFGGVIRPVDPQPPDYVAIQMDQSNPEIGGQVGMWNMLWEAGQCRRRFFNESTMPPQIAKIADLGDINTIFVPRTVSRYFEYSTLFHILPRATVEKGEEEASLSSPTPSRPLTVTVNCAESSTQFGRTALPTTLRRDGRMRAKISSERCTGSATRFKCGSLS